MKELLTVILLMFLSLQFIMGQSETTEIRKPILVDKSALSGVGLKKYDLKNEPDKQFYQKQLYAGHDISVYVVSTNTWNNHISDYNFDEYVYLINGQSIVKPKEGDSKVFDSGDHLFMPKGFEGEWEIRAGDNLHYELSVITSRRADSTVVLKDLNYVDFSSSILSGCQISFDEKGNYTELLHKGVELTIKLEAERPTEKVISVPMDEMLIHLLSGQLTFTDSEDTEHIFYAGDFFIVPIGLKGKWKSEGHGMIKYMTIEKSK